MGIKNSKFEHIIDFGVGFVNIIGDEWSADEIDAMIKLRGNGFDNAIFKAWTKWWCVQSSRKLSVLIMQ